MEEYDDSDTSSISRIPEGLTSITFGQNFNQNVDKLPNSITSISFGKCFNKPDTEKRLNRLR